MSRRRRSFFDEMRKMWERMDEMMSNFWDEEPLALPDIQEGELATRKPDLDILETDKELVITLDMPGLNKEDIQINVTDEAVEISSEVKKEEKEEKEDYIRRERRYSKFYRRIPLPKKVTPGEAKATYNNGVLEVKLSKKEDGKSFQINVD